MQEERAAQRCETAPPNEVLQKMQDIDHAEFTRVRSLENYDVTPAWAIHHLCQHEAEHRGQMTELATRLSSG